MSHLSESAWAKSLAFQSRLVVDAVLSPRLHNAQDRRRVEARTLWWIGLTGIAVVVAMVFFADAKLQALSQAVPHEVFRFFFRASEFGVVELFEWPLAILLLLIGALWLFQLSPMSQAMLSFLFARVGFLFVAISAPMLVTSVLKRVIGRVRPDSPLSTGPLDFVPFVTSSAGMPSSHTTTVFAAAIAFGTLWPRSRIFFFPYAILIAMSRVMINVHYPSDVVLATLVGVIGALLVRNYFADRNIAITRDAVGRIQVVPNPEP